MVRTLLFVLLALVVAGPLQAQQPAPTRATLRPEGAARLVAPDETPFALPTVRVEHARLDVRTGAVRAEYRIAERLAAPPSDPAAAARAYLRQHAARYGFAPDLADLDVERVVSGAYSHHVTFRQTVGGLPVFARTVHVSLDAGRQPLLVVSAYEPALRARPVPARRLSGSVAAARASALLTEQAALAHASAEMLTPDGHRVWVVRTVAAHAPGEWEVLVDAGTGEPRYVFERSTHGTGAALEAANRRAAPAAFAFGAEERPGPAARARVEGKGYVFDPDPVSTAGVTYGAPGFVDGTQRDVHDEIIEADTPELDAQRRLVALPDLTFAQGRYLLEGPYVRIVGTDPGGADVYTPPTATQPDGFRFSRTDGGFEAVMTYYHADLAQRRVQALDLGRPILEQPVAINPHGYASDDSRFIPSQNRIYLGTGGIDDAEDADVIRHEYAHALLHYDQPVLYQATDGTALHEGWADYWAGSYRRAVLGEEADWRRLFPWDGNNPPSWCGRRLDHSGTWPGGWAYPASGGCLPMQSIYQKGLLWATTLMEVYDALGPDVTDRLVVASHAFIGVLPGTSVFESAAEALVAADQAFYGGAYRAVLLGVLGARGYLDAETYGPTVAHAPLTSTEQAGGTRTVEAEVRGAASPITAVRVLYRYDGGAERVLSLVPQGGNRYAGDLPLPATSATVAYAVEARDARDRVTRLPANPAEAFTFTAGPDVQAPQIRHTPRETIPLAAWPTELRAVVTDNLGLDSVEAVYSVRDAGGAEVATGRFGLAAGPEEVFSARWPVPASALGVGFRVRYRLEARDAAAAPNTSVLPASGWFEAEIVAQGVLVAYGFEEPGDGVAASGAWERGTPSYGLRRARTGQGAWMTGLQAAYPEGRSTSYLTLPELNLEGDAPALVFWHWYDLEAGGQCRTLCDGAAVEASTDGGATWLALEPEGGYPGVVDPANPGLGGRGAWGGYSYGWQRATVPLPPATRVQVRFVLATDAGNVYPTRYNYAGWAVDDVMVTTRRTQDVLPPYAEALPPSTEVRPAGLTTLPFSFDVRDETGVVRAEVRLTYGRDGTTQRDTLRLEQQPDRLDRFSGTFVFDTPTRPGDAVAYTLTLVDAAGLARTYPASGAYAIHYRTVARADVLAEARPTGRWRAMGTAWHVAPAGTSRSVLVLPPQNLPANAETLQFVLRHAYHLSSGAGGWLAASFDEGRTWQALEPEAGYGGTVEGTPAFAGRDTLESVFDLTPVAGRQVRLRLEFQAGRDLEPDEFWHVEQMVRYADTDEAAFEVPRTLALHAAQPNPVRQSATVTYTLDADARVTLGLYDVTGRRVAILVAGQQQAAGSHAVPFDAAALASGVYVLRLQAGLHVRTRPVVVAR